MPPEREPIVAMTTASANRAFLPEQIHSLIVQPVQAASVALQVADVQSTGAQVNAYRVPIVTADPVASWVAEGAEISASDANLGEAASPFYKLAGLTVISKELAEDSSPAAAQLVGNGLARDIARQFDAAFFGAKGSNAAQPAGLENLVGFNAVAGSGTNLDPFEQAASAAETAGVTLSSFVAHPDDALKLAVLKKSTGSNEPLLSADTTQASRRLIAGIPLRVSPAVKKGTVWGIPQSRIIVAIRQDVTLDIDRSVFFTSDRVAVKATMRAAILYPHAAAVQKISLGS